MADSASELESDTSSIDGGPTLKPPSPAAVEQLQKRIESLQQENRVLKMELETYKLKCKTLQEEKKELQKASVNIQARAEQEEEFISNTLLKKIQALKKEKEALAMNYEQEEEFLTNDLSRKLHQLRREKVELENALEQEQESLVNRLWKRMDKLETEKRLLQEKLDQPVTGPPSPRDINNGDTAQNITDHIAKLRKEVVSLKSNLRAAQIEHEEKMAQYAQEEKHIREENLRLQRKLQLEMERRENLCRHLSESESSLEMDDERHFNEMAKHQDSSHGARPRTVSSPIPYASQDVTRPLSPGMNYPAFSPPSPMRRSLGGGTSPFHPPSHLPGTSPPVHGHIAMQTSSNHPHGHKHRPSSEKFARPSSFPDRSDKT
ncbi:coiled-coil domain-containing protein 6-like isoform X2 [Saccostrea echinata]|uniref:coiled-coil domain-containing protein 6-like isoform X2 n=1 Tax=Saccostrea echinata TaxID=191078 RepID=UPI002A7EC128|nr:coiled-coil domain-containing protein 6-like isoform X2 [Saccostrea echinata]